MSKEEKNIRDRLMIKLAGLENRIKDCVGLATCLEEIFLPEKERHLLEDLKSDNLPPDGWIDNLDGIFSDMEDYLVHTVKILTGLRDSFK